MDAARLRARGVEPLKPFVVAFTAAAIVQLYKFIAHWVATGRPLFVRLIQTGGMPQLLGAITGGRRAQHQRVSDRGSEEPAVRCHSVFQPDRHV